MSKEIKIVLINLYLPVLLVSLMWCVKLVEWHFSLSFYYLGVWPRDWSHWYGILTMPFVHGDWNHLISNSISFLILLFGVLYILKDIGYKAIGLIYLLSGISTWLIGRESWHIGASALIYGFAFFLFLSGVMSKNIRLWAISLLVVFLYGSMVWGLFPIDPKISYEGHLSGAISGAITALIFRKQLPQRKPYEWELQEDNVDEMTDEELNEYIENQINNSKNQSHT